MKHEKILPKWAPRVKQRKIRQFYIMDAKGICDDELIDDVGYGLLSRCKSFIEAVEAFWGKARCPICDSVIVHSGFKEELLNCVCGWQLSWSEFFSTIQNKQLHGAEPVLELFRSYVQDFPSAKTSREKVLLIDRLIHEFHWEVKRNKSSRPIAVNLIEGKMGEVISFLDELTYGDKSTPGTIENYAVWGKKIEANKYLYRSRQDRKIQH